MFSRREVKARGYENFRKFYWPSVAMALIAGVASASGGGNGGSSSSDKDFSSYGNMDSFGEFISEYLAIFIGTLAIILVFAAIGIVIRALIFNNLFVGTCKYFIDVEDNDESVFGSVVYTFKENRLIKVAITMFLRDLFTALWTLLFIIPGIVKAYEYRMIPYILAENPEMDRKEVFALSKQMMNGNKMDAFVYDLSFLGWYLLGCVTCFILNVFYINPYKFASDAVLYTTLRGKKAEEPVIENYSSI